jgi:hypothetical protein
MERSQKSMHKEEKLVDITKRKSAKSDIKLNRPWKIRSFGYTSLSLLTKKQRIRQSVVSKCLSVKQLSDRGHI